MTTELWQQRISYVKDEPKSKMLHKEQYGMRCKDDILRRRCEFFKLFKRKR